MKTESNWIRSYDVVPDDERPVRVLINNVFSIYPHYYDIKDDCWRMFKIDNEKKINVSHWCDFDGLS